MGSRRNWTGALFAAGSLLAAAGSLLAAAASASAAVYAVGPGERYSSPGQVPWADLAPGDTVLIHQRPEPYRDNWFIPAAGLSGRPIVVRGVPDAGARLPVIEIPGECARAAIRIEASPRRPGGTPAWIVIENLEIRGASAVSRGPLAAGILVAGASHVVIRGCRLRGLPGGLLARGPAVDLLVEGNLFAGSAASVLPDADTDVLGVVFQFNRFTGSASGPRLRDGSAGRVVRFNWFETAGTALELGESAAGVRPASVAASESFVYGNVILVGALARSGR